ncbi:MAG: hypothetical protein ACI84R_003365 [Candidatus Azotimanducaceae bacterium]|jgi:hypothetical protein
MRKSRFTEAPWKQARRTIHFDKLNLRLPTTQVCRSFVSLSHFSGIFNNKETFASVNFGNAQVHRFKQDYICVA